MARSDGSGRVVRPPIARLYKLIFGGVMIGVIMIVAGLLLGEQGVFLWFCGLLVLAITATGGSAAVLRYRRGK